jgi:hypothetical protein
VTTFGFGLGLIKGLRRRAGNSGPCCDGDSDGNSNTVDIIDERVNCELIMVNNKLWIGCNYVQNRSK